MFSSLAGPRDKQVVFAIRAKLGLTPQIDVGPYAYAGIHMFMYTRLYISMLILNIYSHMCTQCVAHFVAGIDYIPINQVVRFTPGVLEQTVQVTIIDDLGQPSLEGAEKFELVLRMPTGGSVGLPARTVVTINDSFSDCKSVHMEYISLYRN